MKNRRRIYSIVLSAILLLSLFLPSLQPAYASGSKGGDNPLSSLTDEQRRALTNLEANAGFTIHPDINIDSDQEVDVIVEFTQDPARVELAKSQLSPKRQLASTLEEADKKVEESHEKFKQTLENVQKLKTFSNDSPIITHEYRDAFNGVAISLPGTMIKDLVASGLIKRVWKDEIVQLDLPKAEEGEIETFMIDSVPYIGVDLLHEAGLKGKGMKIGVLDTGIDYNHPDLTNAYQGYRAVDGEDPADIKPEDVKGWDFVENDADPMETTYEEWLESGYPEFDMNGNSFYTSHGSHVSGTIAGTGENTGSEAVLGVAPEAELYSYRVLGPYGSGDMSDVVAGIDKAVLDGMDVINLSLGAGDPDVLSPTSVAVNHAMLAGVVTVVASGNAGPTSQTVGNPGNAAFPITVGASDVSLVLPSYEASFGDEKIEEINLLAKNYTDDIEGLLGQSFSLVDAGLGYANDFDELDVEDAIVLIERGEIPFDEKIRNAKEAGANLVIVFNDEAGQIEHYIGENTEYVPSFAVSGETGELLKEGLENQTFTFTELGEVRTIGDQLAEFSSRGPIPSSFEIKPDLVAPGVNTYSTVPHFINDPENGNYDVAYSRMSGTSMATPHVAGLAALILEANEAYDAFDVKAALMNTSVSMYEEYSVYEIGAGRVDAYAAVYNETLIKVLDETDMYNEDNEPESILNETGSLSYGAHYLDSGDISAEKTVEVTNLSSDETVYHASAHFLSEEDNRKDAEANGITVSLPESLTVEGNGQEEFTAKINVPENAESGVYEGYIVINEESTNESYRIPLAIRVGEKGFNEISLDRHAVPSEWTFHNFSFPFIGFEISLTSPMEYIDVIIKDYETEEAIGFVGTLDGKTMQTDITYYVSRAFQGTVQLFTGDEDQPIEEEMTKLDEGDYYIEVIATDENEDIYSFKDLVVVDNQAPEITFKDYEPGVIEIDESMYTEEDGHLALWVHTNIYDDTIEHLHGLGYDYDQSGNTLGYYDDFGFPGTIPVEANGDAKFGVLPEEFEHGPYNLRIMPVDLATNNGPQYDYAFLKKGTIYGEVLYKNDSVQLDDQVEMNLSLSNLQDFKSTTLSVEYMEELYELSEVKINEEFVKYLEENGLEYTLGEPEIIREEGYFTDQVLVDFEIEGDLGIDGNHSIVDFVFDVVSDNWHGEKGQIFYNAMTDLTYENSKGEIISAPVFNHDHFKFVSKHSTLYGNLFFEAFMHPDGFAIRAEYEDLGAKVTAIGPDGTKYEATIDDSARYEIIGLPVSTEPYTIIVEMPGHLTTKMEVVIASEKDGELIADNIPMNPPSNKAGDINGDGVIDIMDVMRIVALYGSSNEEADLNKDGVVDEIDVRFIEKNFLEIGEDARKEPQEKLGPKGIEDFLKSLGLEPNTD